MDAPITASTRLAHADASRAELLALFEQALARGLHGLCFSAYGTGQSPDLDSVIDEAQLRSRLAIVAPHARWVRTFSCSDGNPHAPRLAHELGLRTLVGAWLGTARARNEAELERIIEVARAGHADLVAIGNEVLLREDLPLDELLDYLRRARAALPGVPVNYVDAYYPFCEHPSLVEACDVLFANYRAGRRRRCERARVGRRHVE
jgi:exo-beta-1,3-glucanase (GH17 family)